MSSVAICLKNVSRSFVSRNGNVTAVRNLSLQLGAGRFVSLLGMSGCGKSTVLNLTAGLLTPDEGTVEIRGEPLAGLNRHATYLFQHDVLLPWKSILENVIFGLRLADAPRVAARDSGMHWLNRMGLAHVAARYPHQLSGGMRRRVALAQNWILNRPLILMDEPFSALDVHTRLQMETELTALWQADAGQTRTVLFVTHDLEESIRLSDEVIVLKSSPGASLVAHYEVDLPRPRDGIALKENSQYRALYRALWNDLQADGRSPQ